VGEVSPDGFPAFPGGAIWRLKSQRLKSQRLKSRQQGQAACLRRLPAVVHAEIEGDAIISVED